MRREICISAYPLRGRAPAPGHIAPLLNRWIDTYSETEKWVYEQVEGEGEFWFAWWDAEKGLLGTEIGPGAGNDISIALPIGHPNPLAFLPALELALDIANNGA